MECRTKEYKIKTVLCAGLFIITMTIGYAQELSVSVHGGVSGLSYESDKGQGSLGIGGGIGLRYTQFFGDHWGILTGVEARYNSNTFELDDNEQFVSNEIDDQGSAFEYRVRTIGYQEDQRFYSVGIPVMLQYRGAVSDKTGFYIGLGAKVLLSQNLKADAEAQTLNLHGYYPDLNLEFDDLPSHGFGSLDNWEADAEVALKTSILLSAEGGLTFSLKENLKLYTGIYLDYGVSDMQKDPQASNIVSYNPESIDGIISNGVLSTENIVEKSNYFAAGVQLKLGFMLGKSKQTTPKQLMEPEQTLEPNQPVELVEQEVVVEQEVESEKPLLSTQEVDYIEQPLVFTEIDKSSVPSSLKGRLDSIANLVKDTDGVYIKVTGHTCDLGSESLNQRVGMQRAESVADYLEGQGVSRSRMEVISQGESHPSVPNTSASNRMKNRRVTLEVLNQ